MENIETVLDKFSFKGNLIDCCDFGSGHINTTYIVSYNNNGDIDRYIVQMVNGNVFKNIDELMDNIFSVTSFLRRVIKENGGNEKRETLNFIKTSDGKKYYRDSDGDCYRSYRFVENSKSYDSVDSAELFQKSGEAFGKFQRYLSDFPAQTLYEIIPNFHNTIWRYENEFLPSVENDIMDRAKLCQSEIEFVKKRKSDCSVLVDLINSGDLPLRVTHNDTKLNNVIFDEITGEAVCVIDLDTVMPGLALYDFGDSIRFGANTCCEDEPDTDKIKIDLDYFEAYARGFLSQAGRSLNKCEIDHLAFASKLMTLECGMRFLTDYLNGDTYFKTDYSEHNLVRARDQFALVKDMELKMKQMEKIIADIKY
ncbi:MAG: aminoglycoside phosphotransferase family protein [Clostridiales bacterium]|nr:aminoglycoside phosphotransferase family protein [Clostridiales bacterium]